jgi:hypothetical protein
MDFLKLNLLRIRVDDMEVLEMGKKIDIGVLEAISKKLNTIGGAS